MLDELQEQWNKSLSWEDCGLLCERMTVARTKLKLEKGLRGPMMRCHHCNAVHEMRLAPITIRSLLFALRNQGVLNDYQHHWLSNHQSRCLQAAQHDGGNLQNHQQRQG